MIYVALIDRANKQILHPYEYPDSDAFEAGERFRGLHSLGHAHCRNALGHGHAVFAKQVFCLIFMDIHNINPLILLGIFRRVRQITPIF